MKLRAGLLGASSRWKQILRQEGFPVDVVSIDSVHPDEWSVLIINRPPTAAEVKPLSTYLEHGGAVLACSGYGGEVTGTRSYREQVEYVISRPGELFDGIGLLDIGAGCFISSESNVLPTENGRNSVFAGKVGDGCAVELPFDPSELMFDSGHVMRLFHARAARLPAEEVSRVAKHELRYLLHHALCFLHHARQLPYAHLWYFPAGSRNLFAFRVDTDGASQAEVHDLYSAAREHNLCFSWYLDVRSHENWLEAFRSMERQEIGVHCYYHRNFPTRQKSAQNITQALNLMKNAGLHPEGFAAPYGRWNDGLAEAIDDSGFLYSSEFSYAFDTLPFYPESGGQSFSALQVPIHPVCVGTLRRIGYNGGQMKEYFREMVNRKLCRNEPLFFYHHPGDGFPDVINDLFSRIQECGIQNVTLAEFARWWKKREAVPVHLTYEEGRTRFNVAGSVDDSVWIEVLTPDGFAATIPLQAGEAARSSGDWVKVCRSTAPVDIRRTREFDMRAFLAHCYNFLIRTFR